MKVLSVSLLALAALTTGAFAADHSSRHIERNQWQADHISQVQMPRPQCAVIEGARSYVNACGEFVPSIFDPGPGAD